MNLNKIAVCLFAGWVICAANAEQQGKGLNMVSNFEKFPESVVENRSGGENIEIISDESGAKKILVLSNEKNHSDYIGFNIVIPPALLPEITNKNVTFSIYVKPVGVEPEKQLSMNIRAFQHATTETKWKCLWNFHLYFNGDKDKWTLFSKSFKVPDLPEIEGVDIRIDLKPALKNIKILFKDPVLTRSLEKKTQRISPLICFNSFGKDKAFYIVKDGKAAATIITAENPTKCVEFAVKELNDHLELCTGARLSVATEKQKIEGAVVHVGKTFLTERLGVSPEILPPDNWIVRSLDNVLILSGGDNSENVDPVSVAHVPFGTLFAVYEFLERKLGVRWYWPGKLGIVAPKTRNVKIDSINWQGAPSYEVRFVWYRNPEDSDLTKEDIHKWWRRLRWGGRRGNPIGMHSYTPWIERFGEEHPEYFALQKDGKRLNYMTKYSGHVCLSNPEVLKQTIKDKQDAFKKTKSRYFSPVMPGDAMVNYHCNCEECLKQIDLEKNKRGRFSNQVWGFVNKVAGEVRKSYPDRFITCCAYSNYRAPPDFPLMPNIAVTLCVNDDSLPNNIWAHDSKKTYGEFIRSWERTGADLYVWDYWDAPRRRRGNWGAPAIFPHVIKEYFSIDCGRVKGHVIELCEVDDEGIMGKPTWKNWLYDSLNIYVGMQLLWCMDQDVDKILDEFFRDFYGPAAEHVRNFYAKMEHAYADPATKDNSSPHFGWRDWDIVWEKTYPPEFVKEMMEDLRAAVKITEGKEPYHSRAVKTLNGFMPFEKKSVRYSGISRNKRPPLVVTRATRTPVIDGTPDEACWKNAVCADEFVSIKNNMPSAFDTKFQILYDKQNLYIAVTAFLPDNSEIKKDEVNNVDSFAFQNESCEVFLAQNNRKYQFVVDAAGNCFNTYQPDCKLPFKYREMKWQCDGMKLKTKRQSGKWTAELLIPLSSLNLNITGKGNPWNVNFCRSYFSKKGDAWESELSSWQVVPAGFHDVKSFGGMRFKDHE